MTKIHGIAYVLVGIFIMLASMKIDTLVFFFYAGIVFILIGFVKIGIGITNQKKEESSHKPASQHVHPQHLQKIRQQYKRCPRCGTLAHMHDTFCRKCGMNI